MVESGCRLEGKEEKQRAEKQKGQGNELLRREGYYFRGAGQLGRVVSCLVCTWGKGGLDSMPYLAEHIERRPGLLPAPGYRANMVADLCQDAVLELAIAAHSRVNRIKRRSLVTDATPWTRGLGLPPGD